MMDPIPEGVVERKWKEVAQFTPGQIQKENVKLGTEQRDLLGFVVEMTGDMGRPVKELAVYMLFVIFRMFQKAYGKKLKSISSGQIMECYEADASLMGRLEGAHERFLDRIAGLQIVDQPHVMKYVVDTLVEADEDEDFRDLTGEDKGFIFLLLKAVVDVLNKFDILLFKPSCWGNL
jgi:hypothetical protein